MELWNFLDELKEKLDSLEDIKTEDYNSIEDAVNNARLEKPIWNRVNNVVAVFADLKNSTQISNRKTKRVYAKFLEYTGYPFVKINEKFDSKFIDIKGDGGLSLFSGRYAEIKAFLAAETFKTFQEKYVRGKFKSKYNINLSFGIGISKGDLLVKRIGRRKEDNNFFVWAGNAVNNAALISKYVKISSNKTIIGVSKDIYHILNQEKFRDYLILSCECSNKRNLWEREERFIGSNIDIFYKIESDWCKKHGEEYINTVLEIINES
ncbi:adenylate/guanylate cyclase domain-containing protein [Persephonella sp. IF05-L8]|uniref:adenylate/guanylate cyclase domain-containing protein n=1 Tax=Persephonella sp. IF05-L8 TaxID=1158338 RepID=UPI0004962E22